MEPHTPQYVIHRAVDRGFRDHGWLTTRHSFSFADWYEPTRMGFGALRVLNDDTLIPGSGFGTHGHRDMEIVSVVTRGTLAHRDSMGTVRTLSPGEVQVMSAGTGVLHSEYNEGAGDLAFFQIWIVPNTDGISPRYEQRLFADSIGETLLVAPRGQTGALTLNQDAYLSRITLAAHHPHTYRVKRPGHGVYLFVVYGSVTVCGATLEPRDAIGIEGGVEIDLLAMSDAEVLAIEVPMI